MPADQLGDGQVRSATIALRILGKDGEVILSPEVPLEFEVDQRVAQQEQSIHG